MNMHGHINGYDCVPDRTDNNLYEPDDLVDCACGHRDYPDEVLFDDEGNAIKCINCRGLRARNTDHEERKSREETDV